MDEFHNSTLYDNAQMNLALNIGNNYFIHEGIVPGYAASHGCIRVFPLHARFLFYKWAKPGIPGEIIDGVSGKKLILGVHLLKRRRFRQVPAIALMKVTFPQT